MRNHRRAIVRAALLSVIAVVATCLGLLGTRPAPLRAQTIPGIAPIPSRDGGGTVCPGGASPLAAAVGQRCPPLPTPTPSPAPRPTPVPNPGPPPILVPCGPTYIPAGQVCNPQFPAPQPYPYPIVGPGNPQPVTGGSSAPAPVQSQPTTVTTPQSSTPPVPVNLTITGQNPLQITIRATQYVNFTHSVNLNLAPGVQANGVAVTTGTATIEGSQVVWNGFTLDAGQEATATVSLAVTGGGALTASGAPALQSISLEALDINGNPLASVLSGGGPTVAQLVTGCTTPGGQVLLACSGTGNYASQTFSVSGAWDLSWGYGSCPDGGSPLDVSVLNSDGSPSGNPDLSQTSGGGAGTQSYQLAGSLTLAVTSPCAWTLQVQQS